MTKVYLDYAAATPAAKEVVAEMNPFFSEKFGNSGSLHSFGQSADTALSMSREIIAGELNAKFNEVVFTGSATEANNHILRGIVSASGVEKPRLIVSALEHESVRETCEELAKEGVEVVTIPVSPDGFIEVDSLKSSLSVSTIAVSVIYASNVVGSIQPIFEIAQIIKEFRKNNRSLYPLFHTDAVQGLQFFELDTETLGVDALTISGQKIYGPKGIGALFLKEEWQPKVAPLITGGSQEFGFRAGTVNTPAVAGFGKAVELVSAKRTAETERITCLRDRLWEGLKREVEGVELNGSMENRLPNNLHVSFPGVDNQELLIELDQVGVAVSVGSACSVRARKPSEAILALGLGEERAQNCIRFSLGQPTTKEEVDLAINSISSVVKK